MRFISLHDANNKAAQISNVPLIYGDPPEPHYRNLYLYGNRIAFECNNFWVNYNGSWYATDEGVRTVTLDGKRLTFVNGILKEVENV